MGSGHQGSHLDSTLLCCDLRQVIPSLDPGITILGF